MERSDSQSFAAADSAGLLSLAAGDVHLWLAYQDEIGGDTLLARYRAMMSAPEREQEGRFHFARDRHRYLVTRALVRTVLSRYAPVAHRDWRFATNDYGRPEIANILPQQAGLSFNLSHTQGLIVLGVTRACSLGVDVEHVRSRTVSIEIADRFFAPEEVSALALVPAQRQQDRFFEYWTFKESYIKARGMGLSLPLDRFSFHYAHEHAVGIAIHSELGDDPARWRFWQFKPTELHLVAVCAERSVSAAQEIAVRRVVPLVHDTWVEPRFLRTSA